MPDFSEHLVYAELIMFKAEFVLPLVGVSDPVVSGNRAIWCHVPLLRTKGREHGWCHLLSVWLK